MAYVGVLREGVFESRRVGDCCSLSHVNSRPSRFIIVLHGCLRVCVQRCPPGKSLRQNRSTRSGNQGPGPPFRPPSLGIRGQRSTLAALYLSALLVLLEQVLSMLYGGKQTNRPVLKGLIYLYLAPSSGVFQHAGDGVPPEGLLGALEEARDRPGTGAPEERFGEPVGSDARVARWRSLFRGSRGAESGAPRGRCGGCRGS